MNSSESEEDDMAALGQAAASTTGCSCESARLPGGHVGQYCYAALSSAACQTGMGQNRKAARAGMHQFAGRRKFRFPYSGVAGAFPTWGSH